MALGARANLAENFAAAETAYRAALALQQQALGRDNPDTVTALMHLALQVSDQGRFAEADTLFRRADTLAPRASDKAASPAATLSGAERAEPGARGRPWHCWAPPRQTMPPWCRRKPAGCRVTEGVQLASAARERHPALPSQSLMVDPTAQSALIGLIEARRYHAIVLRRLGRPPAAAAIVSAQALARANQMAVPLVSARLRRTSATADDVRGN